MLSNCQFRLQGSYHQENCYFTLGIIGELEGWRWQQMLHDDKVYGISEVLILKRGDVFCWQVLHKCGIVEMESLSPFTILQRRDSDAF